MNDDRAPITRNEIDFWRSHIGRTEMRQQTLDFELLRRFAAAVDSNVDVEHFAPPLAHWAYFLDVAPTNELDLDGHIKRGGGHFLPAIRLPNRMFAGSSIRFIRPLRLGQHATLIRVIADVYHRTGKTGDLVFVELDRTLTQEGLGCVAERQTLVYRKMSPVASITPVGVSALRSGEELWSPGPVELFRFSAVTFNSHRVHYDLPYAQNTEGYPTLIVQAPFTAVKLYAFATAQCRHSLTSFRFKAIAPLFAGQPVRLITGDEPNQFCALRCDGTIAMTAYASAETPL